MLKQALLLFGYAFREDKIKKITDMIYNVVSIVEQLDKSNITKQYIAITDAYENLLEEFDIVLDEKVIKLLVDIAVAYLPKTDKEEVKMIKAQDFIKKAESYKKENSLSMGRLGQ